jgi:hypothetical protein
MSCVRLCLRGGLGGVPYIYVRIHGMGTWWRSIACARVFGKIVGWETYFAVGRLRFGEYGI